MVSQLTPVTSSNIRAMAHDGTTLHVEFLNGQRWSYANVTPAIYNEMIGSGSVGKYFGSFIRKNHAGTRIEPEPQISPQAA